MKLFLQWNMLLCDPVLGLSCTDYTVLTDLSASGLGQALSATLVHNNTALLMHKIAAKPIETASLSKIAPAVNMWTPA